MPAYEQPPVVEVVCGILFKPLTAFGTPHLGLWWQELQPDYPFFEEKGQLIPQVELEKPLVQQPPKLEMHDSPPMPRVWFVSEDQSLVVQVQKDRLLTNWKKISNESAYPRYGQVLNHFQDHLKKFQAFITEAGLGEIEPLQYELTYVNHIMMGEGWNSFGEVGNILPDLSWRRKRDFLPEPEFVNLSMSFPIENNLGRLHIALVSGIRQSDGKPLLQLTLTARGISPDTDIANAPEWFGVAREWIVRGFSDIVSNKMEELIWRKVK